MPVVAAGGIFDGRGLVAALALGAQGIWMGTRFIASTEARAHRAFKDRIVAIDETGTVITRCYSGKTMRAIRTRYTDEWEARKDELQTFPMQAARATQDGVWNVGAGPDGRFRHRPGLHADRAERRRDRERQAVSRNRRRDRRAGRRHPA